MWSQSATHGPRVALMPRKLKRKERECVCGVGERGEIWKRCSLDQMSTYNQFPPTYVNRFSLLWGLYLYAHVPTMQLPVHFTTGLGRFQSYFISKGQSSPAPRKGHPDPPPCVTPRSGNGARCPELGAGERSEVSS